MFYEINTAKQKIVDTAIGNTESKEITEVIEQGAMFGPTISCATTVEVNDVGKKVDYKYGEIEIGMSIYIDDISVAGGSK